MQSKSLISVTGFTVIFLAGTSVLGQQASGTLTGTIYDQSGGPLDRATVTVTNISTGFERSAQPGYSGGYRFEKLPVGKYSLRSSSTGLSTVQINDVFVQANKTSTINVTLPMADARPISVVEVSEAPEPVDFGTIAAPTPSPDDNGRAIRREIDAVHDRLALSAEQEIRIRAIFEDRQAQIAGVRNNISLSPLDRRAQIKAVRSGAEANFRAALNENQLDEYDEILRERRERALEKQASGR